MIFHKNSNKHVFVLREKILHIDHNNLFTIVSDIFNNIIK